MQLKGTLLLIVLLASGCRQARPEPPGEPDGPASTTSTTPVEADLTVVTLSADAERRLGIETRRVERRAVARTRTYAGELAVPPGRSITVSTPLPGTLLAPAGGYAPRPGVVVEAGEEILRLLPLTPPQQDLKRLESEARARLDEVRARTERVQRLYREGVVNRDQHEAAVAARTIAEADLQAVLAQKELLNQSTIGGQHGGISALSLRAPLRARLAKVHAAAGQSVAASAALFELFAEDPLWLRVPVYVGDVQTIEPDRPAQIHDLGSDAATPAGRSASPIQAPPSADPLSATVDLFFEVANRDGALKPGQKVGATLTLRGGEASASLIVARSAILYDIHGGTWVYERPEPQRYVRRRVEVSRMVDDLAVLSRGPAPGTAVVTVGAAELFGTEFGVDK